MCILALEGINPEPSNLMAKIWLIGLALIVVGVLIIFFGTLYVVLSGSKSVSGEGGVVVVIGPIPIAIGTSPRAITIVLILAIILTILALILFLWLWSGRRPFLPQSFS